MMRQQKRDVLQAHSVASAHRTASMPVRPVPAALLSKNREASSSTLQAAVKLHRAQSPAKDLANYLLTHSVSSNYSRCFCCMLRIWNLTAGACWK